MTDLQLWDREAADLHNGQGCSTWFTYQAGIVRKFAEELNVDAEWLREDYREMCELLIVFFRGTVSIFNN